MKRWLSLAGVVAALFVAGCGPDPIVGKWAMNQNGVELVIDFKKDGTGAIDTAGVEAALAQRTAGNPMGQAMVQRAVQQLKEVKVTWKKEGSVYRTEGTVPGQASNGASYLKLDKEQLVPCDQKGTPSGRPAFTRKK